MKTAFVLPVVAAALATMPLLTLGAGQALAQTPDATQSHSNQTTDQQNAPKPDITTRQEKDRTVKEYRVNGRLYAVKVTPKVGPSYYLVDSNGDGDFERTPDGPSRIAIPKWTLLSW